MKEKKTYYIKSDVFADWMWHDNDEYKSLGESVSEMLGDEGKITLDLQEYLNEVGYLETSLIENWDREEEGELGDDFQFDFDNAEFKILYPKESEVAR